MKTVMYREYMDGRICYYTNLPCEEGDFCEGLGLDYTRMLCSECSEIIEFENVDFVDDFKEFKKNKN